MKPSSLVSALVSGSAAATSGLFTTLLILLYLLISGETFLRRMVEILPRFKDKRQAVELSQHIERDVSAYLLTVTCINVGGWHRHRLVSCGFAAWRIRCCGARWLSW